MQGFFFSIKLTFKDSPPYVIKSVRAEHRPKIRLIKHHDPIFCVYPSVYWACCVNCYVYSLGTRMGKGSGEEAGPRDSDSRENESNTQDTTRTLLCCHPARSSSLAYSFTHDGIV